MLARGLSAPLLSRSYFCWTWTVSSALVARVTLLSPFCKFHGIAAIIGVRSKRTRTLFQAAFISFFSQTLFPTAYPEVRQIEDLGFSGSKLLDTKPIPGFVVVNWVSILKESMQIVSPDKFLQTSFCRQVSSWLSQDTVDCAVRSQAPLHVPTPVSVTMCQFDSS